MSRLLNTIKIWSTAVAYGILVLFYIVKQCFTKGFGKVFHWKRWDPPNSLTDPSLGIHGFLTLKDVRIHYVVSGPEDKPLMLFVHGFPEFWYSWRYQIREFHKDYRVVAIDQRGYNESSKPSGIDSYSVTTLCSDLEQVIHALGYKSCVLVAHDWGAVVAWAFGRHYPDLVDKLIVMNGPPARITEQIIEKNKKQRQMLWYVFFFRLPCLPELLFKLNNFSVFDDLLASERKPNNSEITDEIKDESISPYKYVFSQPGALTPPINYYRMWLKQLAAGETSDYDLEYTMPVLLVWGCQDKALDIAVVEAIEKVAPKITVKKISDASHFVQMDAPDEVNKIMREWLAKE